jgi:PKD repeat protein
VQTYDGFFRAGQNVSIYRFDYVGGPSTPSAAPRATAIGGYQVRFDVGSSGGVSYKWDFGDGESSTEANPTHKYAEAKKYTATLTVTYGDGSTDKSTVDVTVLAKADETAPTTTYAFDPATPGNGGTYTKPVHVTLTATDDAEGSGVDKTEYRFNGGDWQLYTGTPVTRTQPGDYTLEFRSTDKTGNVEATKSVTFKIEVVDNCQPSLNDEFDGTTLDGKWQILRDTPSARSLVNGRLQMLVRNGDMIGNTATAKNVLLQDAPDGSWQATTRLDVSTLTTSGDQAGFILWQSENPNTFAKVTFISKGATQQYEYVATRNGASDIHTGPSITPHPSEVYLRLTANGSGTYIAEGSTDGETWQAISTPITGLGDPKTIKVGLKISNGQDNAHHADFDYFRVDCSDKIAPITTAKLDPAQPDGKLGWYSKSPEVTLTADDGVGDGVDKITYTVDGGAEQAYNPEAPITTTGDGEHTVAFFATDKAGNVEPVKSTAFRVDSAAPKTGASVTMSDKENGPATVTLDPADGDKGSGAVLTQYRVDGGPWQVYQSKAEQLFDGSAASLAQWKQAGAGHFELMKDGSGGITPVDGLGMLWYPKVFKDYRLHLQFREGRTDGGHSNGGVFIRFPDITQQPRKDDCAKVAGNDDAWVAIYCGYELQIYDGTDGETRKTGSIYTFDNNDIDHIGPAKPVGEWEDYDIEVRGMNFKIFRNGTKIMDFDNTPGKESDRGGDPPSDDRQFTEGYIGLQNHSLTDLVQYRDVRIEDLSEGATPVTEAKPFQVTGKGPHTVEVRSIDAAGNVEEKTAYPFEIGTQTAPQPAQPQPLVPVASNPIMPPMINTPATYRLGTVASKLSVNTFRKRGLKVPVQCTGAMTGTVKLTISSKDAKKLKLASRTIKSSDVRCWGQHTATVTLKPSSTIAKRLRAKRAPKRVKLSLAVTMHDFGAPSTTTRKTITLRK